MNLYFNLHHAVSCDLDRFDQTISRMSSPDKSLPHVYILMSLSLHRGLSNWVRGQVNDPVWRAWNWVTDLKAQRSPWEFSDKHGFFWLDWNNKVVEGEMQIRKVQKMHWMQLLSMVHPVCTEIMLNNSSEQFFQVSMVILGYRYRKQQGVWGYITWLVWLIYVNVKYAQRQDFHVLFSLKNLVPTYVLFKTWNRC